eukprot:12335144-Karenia_brevis.AAC.1
MLLSSIRLREFETALRRKAEMERQTEITALTWNVAGVPNSFVDDLEEQLEIARCRWDIVFLQEFTKRSVKNFVTERR